MSRNNGHSGGFLQNKKGDQMLEKKKSKNVYHNSSCCYGHLKATSIKRILNLEFLLFTNLWFEVETARCPPKICARPSRG